MGSVLKAPFGEISEFRNSNDIVQVFQQILNEFPRQVDNDSCIDFSEFGAYLIRPQMEPQEQLTHLLAPQTIVGIPNSTDTVRLMASSKFPGIQILADVEQPRLFLRICGQDATEERYIKQISVVLPMDEVFLVPSLWDAFDVNAREQLDQLGFSRKMGQSEWAEKIASCEKFGQPTILRRDSQNLLLRKLPYEISRMAVIGSRSGYHPLPEFVLQAIENNTFVYPGVNSHKFDADNAPYELGDIHVHSYTNPFHPFQEKVARIVGEDIARRNPSVPDVALRRHSRTKFDEIRREYSGNSINAMITFFGILTVDEIGNVNGARYLDFGDADFDELARINDRAYKTLYEEPMADPQIVAEHYQYIDELTKEVFGQPDSSPLVGKRDS